MIPQLVTVGWRRPDGRRRRLYIPVLPVLLLLSPLLVLAVVAGLIACLATQVNPAGALSGIGRLLWSLPGTRFDIAEGRTAFLVSVR
ncbi:hypothetical protein ABT354_37395 [Streptomyces sp. NPDC000594]|uniref:hypothetical protein n=1 Tax=Streptomyces sp. NPDC000594 TaxID=3154261 RepID=UPI00331C4E55